MLTTDHRYADEYGNCFFNQLSDCNKKNKIKVIFTKTLDSKNIVDYHRNNRAFLSKTFG